MAVTEGDEGQMEEDKDDWGCYQQLHNNNINKKTAEIGYDTQPLRVCIWS